MNLGPREPDNDMVICPNCTCQFVAIPVNVQARLAEAERLLRRLHNACIYEAPEYPARLGNAIREAGNWLHSTPDSAPDGAS